MVVKFRDLGQSATKLQTNGQNASQRYATNAVASAGDWATNTAASGDNWAQGVQGAITRGSFASGVTKAGPGKYSAQVTAFGQSRFSDGISKAGASWQKGFSPIAQSVAGKDIGPRGPRGSQANYDRAKNMAQAFRAAKLGTA